MYLTTNQSEDVEVWLLPTSGAASFLVIFKVLNYTSELMARYPNSVRTAGESSYPHIPVTNSRIDRMTS